MASRVSRHLLWLPLCFWLVAFFAFWFAPNSHGALLGGCLLSLAFSTLHTLLRPKQIFLHISFLPGILLCYLHPSDQAWLAVALGLLARAWIANKAWSSQEQNLSFAAELKKQIPEEAQVFVDIDIDTHCPSRNLHEGHIVRINPNDTLPADGLVTFGSSFVDESPFSGDKNPRSVSMGSYVFAGSINKNGSFLYRAHRGPQGSFVYALASQMEKNHFSWNSIFLYHGIFSSIALFPLALGGSPELALNVFLVSTGSLFCVNRLVLLQAFVARSAAEGFSWASLKKIRKISAVKSLLFAPEKILLEQKPKISEIYFLPGHSEDSVLRLAGPLARKLEDSYSFAVLQELQVRSIRLEVLDAYSARGEDVQGVIGEDKVRWIPFSLVAEFGIPYDSVENFIQKSAKLGEIVYLLFQNGEIKGAISFKHPLEKNAAQEVQSLQESGVSPIAFSRKQKSPFLHLLQETKLAHIYGNATQNEFETLLKELRSSGLHPAVMDTGDFSCPPEIPTATDIFSFGNQDCALFRLNLESMQRLIRTCRKHQRLWKLHFYGGICLTLILVGLAPHANPLLLSSLFSLSCLFPFFAHWRLRNS